MSLRIRRIERLEDFEALGPAWGALASEAGRTSPFLSHDWFTCCWKAVGPERAPEILLIEETGSPVALVPLVRYRERLRGLPVRALGFLDCPDTPWVDVVAAADTGRVVDTLLDHLGDRADWDVVHLQKLPATSPTLKALEAALGGRFRWGRAGTLSSPYLAIDGEWEAFYAAKSPRFKKTCRNIQNRLERAGRVSIEEHRAVDPGGTLLADIFELTGRSWKSPRGLAIATMPGMREFFTELTDRATARGWLSLWLLRVNGRPLAMEYQLRADGLVHALRADYDEAHRELSPGSALSFAIARALFSGGTHEYDMGPGLNDYKLRWATGSHETVDLRIHRQGLYPGLLHAVETAVLPAARRLRERLR